MINLGGTVHGVSILLNEGNGTFADEVSHSVGEGPRCLAIDDLDANGFNDIVVVNTDDHDVAVLLNRCEPTCPADFDGTGDVDVSDLLQLLGAWGACSEPCPEDLDGDGTVNVSDLLALLAAWGPC